LASTLSAGKGGGKLPINSACGYLLELLDQLPIPGPAGTQGALQCYITPPDPGTLNMPSAYLWPVSGTETRLTSPRAGGPNVAQPGWKHIQHRVQLYLAFVGTSDDPTADTTFPAVLDAIMAALRPSPDEAPVTDPVTGIISSFLLGIGEEMTYDYAVVHTLADQRYLRYDARLQINVNEYFQS
jgi:hypothetical protein